MTWDMCRHVSDFLLDSFPQVLELLQPVLLTLLPVDGGQGRRGQRELGEPLRVHRRRRSSRGVAHYHRWLPLGGDHMMVTRVMVTGWLSTRRQTGSAKSNEDQESSENVPQAAVSLSSRLHIIAFLSNTISSRILCKYCTDSVSQSTCIDTERKMWLQLSAKIIGNQVRSS